MKTKEIEEKETEQLRHELDAQRRHLFDLRTQAVTEKLEDPSQLGKTRKTIARMKTVLRRREIEQKTQQEQQKQQQPAPATATATATTGEAKA